MVIKMSNKEKLKELASRAKKRLELMSSKKTSEDVLCENQDFAFFEQQITKQIIDEAD